MPVKPAFPPLLCCLQLRHLAIAGATILDLATVDQLMGIARVPALADFALAPEVDQGYVEGVNVRRDDGEQEEDRVDGDVPAQAADEEDGEGREEDADDGDGYALENHCDGG